MARKYQGISAEASLDAPVRQPRRRSGITILIVDDSQDVLDSTTLLLEAEGHRVLTASNGQDALDILEEQRVHVLLLDYFMPRMTGEEVVRRVREKDRLVQIVLQTGYSGEKPARVMMRELDIQAYHDKSEGPERLLLWVDAAIKASHHVLAMEKHRVGLRFILDITPELHRLQPLDELLEGLLWQIEGLLGAENSFLATVSEAQTSDDAGDGSEGFVALVEDEDPAPGLRIRFGTGRFNENGDACALLEEEKSLIQDALTTGAVHISNGSSIVPLVLGNRALGLIYLDKQSHVERDRELLAIYARQAAAAIQNSLLYDMATVDTLTGTYVRGFAIQQLQQSIKQATRRSSPFSILMLDLDRFKLVNDTYGHQAGDMALQLAGKILKDAVRETDLVGRYGGDEFIVLLPDTPAAGALIVANRLLARAANASVEYEGQSIPIALSVGVATLQPADADAERSLDAEMLQAASDSLIASADRALYAAKGTGTAGDSEPLSLDLDAVTMEQPM